MKGSYVFITTMFCFLMACTTPVPREDNYIFNVTGITREIIQAYNQKDYPKVMELANQAVQKDENETIPQYYAALACFKQGYDERGMKWFFLALDNSLKKIEETDSSLSLVIPAYRESIASGGSQGVSTALWFLYMAVGEEREAEKIFPNTEVIKVDQVMAVRGDKITKALCKYTILFCAKHKDQERMYQFVDVMVWLFIFEETDFELLEKLLKWPSVIALDKKEYIKEILSNKKEKCRNIKILEAMLANNKVNMIQLGEMGDFLNKWELCEVYSYLAYSLHSSKIYSVAELWYLLTLEIRKTIPPEGNHPVYIETLNNLASLYESMGNYTKAEPLYQQTLEIRKTLPPEGKHPDFAVTLNSLGGLYKAIGNYSKAESLYLQALEIFKTLPPEGKHPEYAIALNNLAVLYTSMGNYSKAEYLYLQALEINKTLPPEGKHPEYAITLINLAELNRSMDNYTKAEPLYLQALEILKILPFDGKNKHYFYTLLNHLGMLYIDTGYYSKAETYLLQALEFQKKYQSENNHPDFAAILYNLGILYLRKSDYIKSELYLLKALEIQKNYIPSGRNPDYITTLNGLAGLYNLIGDYSKAEPLYLQALNVRKILQPAGRCLDYAITLSNLGSLYLNIGEYSKAKSLLLQALEITKNISPPGKHSNYSKDLNILAMIYQFMGEYQKAESLYLQSLEIEKTLHLTGRNPDYINLLCNLGSFYRLMGNYARAELFYLQALEIEKTYQFEDRGHNYMILYNNLAGLYKDMRDYNKAASFYTQALETLTRLSPEGRGISYATIMNNVALFFKSLGDYKQAELFFLDSLKLVKSLVPENRHRFYAITLNNLAGLYESMGNYSKAEPLFLQALEITEKLDPEGKNLEYGDKLNNLGILYENMGDYKNAGPLLIQSLSLYQEFLQSNIIILSEREKENFINTLFPLFERFNSFVEKYFPEDPTLASIAVNFRLFRKAIIFHSVRKIRERIRKSGNQEINDDFNTWLILRRQINRVYELTEEQRRNKSINLKAWEEEANVLEKKLSSRSEDFRLAYEQKEYTWQDIRNALKPGEAAIELVRYRVYEKKWTGTIHYAVIIIKPDSRQPEIIFLKNGNILEEEIIIRYKNFMEETMNNPFALADTNTYNILYTQLWQPIASRLEGVKRIYFSPDGIYHFINPCTLQDDTGRWLGERWEIVRITSLQDIVEKQQVRNVSVGPPVFAGCPAFDLDAGTRQSVVKKYTRDLRLPDYERITYLLTGTLQSLPGTREEVEGIARLYRERGENPEVWLGEAALEECIKRVDNPAVLHLATHAFFQQDIEPKGELQLMSGDTQRITEDPLLRTGILFTGAARTLSGKEPPEGLENGILTAREALDLNLDSTELVVLSACDTGLGEIKNGEGVYGLQRAFLIAGADAVLMSLWKVDDKAACDFMITFYSKWLSGMSKREAYCTTVDWMKKKYPSPYYWGAFILVGE